LLIIAVLWSGWWRGRWSFGLAGLEIRRQDGAPVEPWRAMLRTFLLTLPLIATQWLSDVAQWETRLGSVTIQWNQLPGALLLFVTLFWVIWKPERCWHDYLAGTTVVPR
ncbi:MAG TPA: RDD family protein, partial [Gemmatales bacterium]|nr:RDD family protein [Gemmatales bacterium]